MTQAQAATFLRTLRTGDPVTLEQDGRSYAMTVGREYMRADGAYGDPNGGSVTVTLGVGRWSTTVSAPALAAGRVALVRSE